MTEQGLYLDLKRMVDQSVERALKLNHSWDLDHVYITPRAHRMHTVCGTLAALGYMAERFVVGERADESAWSLTEAGMELYEELRVAHRIRARKA